MRILPPNRALGHDTLMSPLSLLQLPTVSLFLSTNINLLLQSNVDVLISIWFDVLFSYSKRQHLVDVTEIFNLLNWEKKKRLFKLAYIVLNLFLTIFW